MVRIVDPKLRELLGSAGAHDERTVSDCLQESSWVWAARSMAIASVMACHSDHGGFAFIEV